MQIPIDSDLCRIAQIIVDENLTLDEWPEVESDDQFQEGPYIGGFDACEEAFCFAFMGPDSEHWFEVTLSQMEDIASGGKPSISGRKQDSR